MRRLIAVLLVPVVSGCATSSASLGQMGVEFTVPSSKTAQQFATCAAEILQGEVELRGSGDHWWILRSNMWDVPIVRWDFKGQPNGGSIAELRATAIAGAGKDKVQRCA